MGYFADSDLLYEEAACGLLVTEANGNIVRANRTFCAWLGRTPDELIGRRLQSLLSIGGRIFHQTHWAPLLKMQGSLSEVKLEMLHADGHKIPMVMNAIVRQRDGIEHHELAIFSARDRHKYEQELLAARQRTQAHLEQELETQRQLAESQTRLELALEAVQLYQWSVDIAQRERSYMPEVALLLGYAAPRPLSADEFIEHIVPQDRDLESSALAAFLNSGGRRFHMNFRVKTTGGGLRWVAAWGRTRLDTASTPTHLVGVLQDVTEAHRQRALAEDRALLAEQTLGIVGHDLRNPLSAIHVGAEVLSRPGLDTEKQRAVVARIQSSTRRANRLIADLLDFTQARNGRGLRIKRSQVDAHAVARDVVAELQTAFPSRRLQHVITGDGATSADGDRLAQALGNLVSNALTYGLEASPVTVTSEGLESQVRISVHNEGQPIDPALMPTLFEPMTRGENPGHLRSVGLGLYIVREIAHAHQGTVECVSDGVQGTTFLLTVPRAGL